jgi:hypothetical protein
MFRFCVLLSTVLLGGAAGAEDNQIRRDQPVAQPMAFEQALPSQGLRGAPRAGDDLWSAVVLATNVPAPKAAPAALRSFAPQLSRVFGYNQFEFIGSDSQKIVERAETRLMPTKSLWMAVKARRATSKEARGGYLLNVQLYREDRPLVDTEARLAPGSPMFIRGPQYGNGQIIVVLQIQ